jgi:CubicO group peptidase (beta-lactamase class C family)
MSIFNLKPILSDLEKDLTGFNLAVYEKGYWEDYSFGFVDDRKIKTNQNKLYDLASLTKTFTATQILLADKKDLLNLSDPASKFLDFLENFPDIKIEDLLSHKTDLDIIEKYDKSVFHSVQEIENKLFNKNNLVSNGGGKINENGFKYSDLNYLFLGKILEKIYNQNLDKCFENFCEEFDLKDIAYRPLDSGFGESEIVKSENGVVLGKVQDEKSNWLGGITGHSGLFGSSRAVQSFLELWLNNSFELDEKIYKKVFYNDFKVKDLDKSSAVFGLVFRSGWLTSNLNHAGFSGPFLVLDSNNKKALVLTTNHHFPKRDFEKRDKLVLKYRKLIEVFMN